MNFFISIWIRLMIKERLHPKSLLFSKKSQSNVSPVFLSGFLGFFTKKKAARFYRQHSPASTPSSHLRQYSLFLPKSILPIPPEIRISFHFFEIAFLECPIL